MANTAFRSAFWAMLLSLGLIVAVCIPQPERVRNHLLAATHNSLPDKLVGFTGELSTQHQGDAMPASSDHKPLVKLQPIVPASRQRSRIKSQLSSKTQIDQPQIFHTLPITTTRDTVHQDQQNKLVENQIQHLENRMNQLAQADMQHQLKQATELLEQIQTYQNQSRNNSQRPTPEQPVAVQQPLAVPPAPTPPAPTPPAPDSHQPTNKADKPAVLKAEPNPSNEELFSLQIEDAELSQVLKMLGEMTGQNILVGQNVSGKVTANLQDVSVEKALHAILRSQGYVYERDESFIYVMTPKEAAERKLVQQRLVTRIFRPQYISVADLQALITPLLTPNVGKIAVTNPNSVGIESNSAIAGGDRLAQSDALLVQDYPEVILELDEVVAEMDIPPLQVVIEAMILSVKLTDSMEFGVNFALLNSTNNSLGVFGNGATLNDSSGFPGPGSNSIVPPAAEFIANTAGLKYGLIQGDLGLFIKALENITDTNMVASPQLRVLNKQKAELIIGDRISYKTLAFNGTQTVENVSFLDSGTKLLLRPFIGHDGRVRMEIHPERSSAIIDPQTGLPNQATTEVTTNVMVQDGSTVVIGGLIEEQIVESFERVPLLGSLPLVGKAFRNKTERTDRTELIVLITPRIVREDAAAEEGELAMLENTRRARHFRDNLAPINRYNLARIHFERAEDLLNKGNYLRAKKHIDHSLRISKNDIDALRLRDVIDAKIESEFQRFHSWPAQSAKSKNIPIPPEPIQPVSAETPLELKAPPVGDRKPTPGQQ